MLKPIITISAIQALAIVINLARSKFVAVSLGPEGVGVISTIDQMVQLSAQLCAFSIPFAAVKFLSKSHSEGFDTFRKVYSGFLKALVVLSVAGALVSVALAFFRADAWGAELSRYRLLLILAPLSIPTMVLGNFFISVLAAAQKSTASAMMAVVTSLVLTTSACAGILIDGVPGLYVANACAGAALTFGTLVYLRGSLNLPLHDPTVKVFEELRQSPNIILFSVMLYVSTFAYLFSFMVARYLVLKNLGEAEAGLLQAVMAVGLAIGMVLNPANGLLLTPTMNRSIPKVEKVRAAAEFQKKLTIILGVVAVPLVLFPQSILTLLFSGRFAAASEFLFLFVIWQFLLQAAGVYQALLIGFDDLKAYAIITCAGYSASALLSWLLIAHYGIHGVAISFILSSSLIFLLSLLRLRSRHGFRVTGGLASLTAYSLLATSLIGAISIRHGDWNIIVVSAKVGAYVVFLAGLLLFLTKEERASLFGLWGKLSLGAVR